MKKNNIVIAVIALLLFAIVAMDIFLVFDMTREQTRTSGSYQLASVSGALENTLNEAINTTMGVAIEISEILDDREAVHSFLVEKKSKLSETDNGYNVYIASDTWDIIPDLNAPEGYIAQERLWYTGALRNNGKPYVSSPYIDALSGNICFTVSVMLGDRKTVIAIDYTLDSIQAHIDELHSTEMTDAVIVTDEGYIAGSTDSALIGRKLFEELPEYAGIYMLAKNSTGVVTGSVKKEGRSENLFATKTGNGWYLIVSESEWNLYKNSYVQLGLTFCLSLALFSVIIILYVHASRSRKKAEIALSERDEFISGISGELKAPLDRILEISSREGASQSSEPVENEFKAIREAGISLNDKLAQVLSYKSILRSEKSREHNRFSLRKFRINNRFRFLIILIMLIVMGISVYTNVYTTYQLGYSKMQSEAGEYRDKLENWFFEQKSKLDMFCSFFSTNPGMLDDYEKTVSFLNNITEQYPEISASYITNPEREHTVYMNNGWEPDPDKPVQDRPWYRALSSSSEGWIITTPYYDQQTGGYCVTIAKTVLDGKTGEFVGNFGIDFYMESLVNILGGSYSDTGYAFLVDNEGEIVNHPYGKYQMTADTTTNIADLSYGNIATDASSIELISDYDSDSKLLIATRSNSVNFSVYVVKSFMSIFGSFLIYNIICFVSFIICILLVYKTLGNMIRWQDMTNARMKEAADTAIAAGKAKNQFLAQMSHEIRTPINAVLGMNEMILHEATSDAIREYSSNIKSSGRNLLALINSILDFSKIEDGKMEIIPASYELSTMVTNLINSVKERAKAKSLRFITDIDPTLPSVLFGDDVRLSQVIMNLLTNAVKYTHEGSVTLTLRDAGREGDMLNLFVSVKDTGIGIKSDDMRKLFESFERIEEIRNRNIEGTGLGMSIVTKLLGMMDSELHVDSIYGVGSEFSFTIRQKIVSDEAIGDNKDGSSHTAGNSEDSSKKTLFAGNARILVVDDNDMNLKVARNLLKLFGIKPDLASSGVECIDLVKKNKYDLIFMDHMMPGMDGIVTLKHIRDEGLVSTETPVIVLTANAVIGAKEKYLEAGFDDYLSKPIELEELQAKLLKNLPAEKKDDLPEIISFAPSGGNNEDEVLEFGPTNEDILEFGPTSDDILEFGPSSDDEKEAGGLPASMTEELRKALEQVGINTEEGLRFCGKEEAFYIEMLDNYVKSVDSKGASLEEYFGAEKWSDYQILIHSVKSTSKTIGSEELFLLAKSLEEAAGAKDTDYINNNHQTFMDKYRKLAASIDAAIR